VCQGVLLTSKEMGETAQTLVDFDPYNYVPPPVPLLDPATLVDPCLSPNSRLSRGQHRAKAAVLDRVKGRRNRTCDRNSSDKGQDRSLFSLVPIEVEKAFCTDDFSRTDQQIPIAEPCTCQFPSPDYLHTKAHFPLVPTPIPLIYRDYTDHLFDLGKAYSKYPCVYHRPRTEDFSHFTDNLLDPGLPAYGGSAEQGDCSRHRKAKQQRIKREAQALSYSEFVFDSYFESGNLDRAVIVGPNEFHLFLTPDSNTQGYTQWFSFSIRNQHRGQSISLSLVNFTKNGSPFGRGMKPSALSLARARLYGTSWAKTGYDVRYLKNSLPRGNKGLGTYYTLSFSYTFTYDNDTVCFAYAEPYTYTRLCRFLGELKQAVGREVRVEEKTLAKTVGGLNCAYVLVGDYSSGSKKKVGVTARVHPGETVGSFMVEGLLRFLVSAHPAAAYLRRACDFYVVPMLNPDGVVMGNTRTGLVGVDLNRKWDQPDPTLHPVISAAKELLSGSTCFIDLHGHSKKDFCFMYGNSFSRQDERFWASRFLPICMAKLTAHFSYPFCYFFNSQSHDKAARTVMFSEKRVLHSFTLEASFNGSCSGEKKTEFDPTVLREIGCKLGESIYGLMAYLLKKSGKEVSTQDGVYSLANQLISRLKQTRAKPIYKSPAASVSTGQEEEADITDKEPAEAPESTEINEEASDSDPESDNLPPAEFVSLQQAITCAIHSLPKVSAADSSPQRRLLKASSKLLYKDPVERIQLHFLGPSHTQSPLSHSPFHYRKPPFQDEDSSPPVERVSRGSLVPMRKYAQVLSAIRRKSHSPGETTRTPKDMGLEGYLQLVREVRRKLVSRVPAL